jgi:hypothetical protein
VKCILLEGRERERERERNIEAQDNAKLSLLNQQLAVQALNKMAKVIGRLF